MKKIGILLLLILSLSCTRTKPEISYGFLQLVLYQGETGIQERFSFFIIPQDEDGIENLDKLYLYNDKEQLRWQINSDEWIKHSDSDKKIWIGTRSITVAEGSMPRGVYRAVLVNKGGESAEKSFTFDANVMYIFPELTISNGNYSIISAWPGNRLICYDNSGAYISDIPVENLTGQISALNLPSNTVTVALWADDEANFCSAYTSVVPIN